MSLVSIIVPVYNAQDHLVRCLDSLVDQSLKDIEIILINDGSTDTSGKICDHYESKDARIKVIHQDNTGQGIARNRGIKEAKSPYIGFVDADDWVALNMFEKLYQVSRGEDADITMCNCYEIIKGVSQKTYIKTTSNILNHEEIIKEIILPMIGGLTIEDHYQNNIPGYLCRCLYKSALIKPLKIISERKILFEDLWFNIEAMYKSTKIVIEPEHLYHYIHHNDSFVRTYKDDIWTRKQRLSTLISKFFKEKNKFDLVESRLYTRQIIDLLESINNETYSQNIKSIKDQKQEVAAMCLDRQTQKALRHITLGQISNYQKLRLTLIKKHHFSLLYYLSKGAYYYKQRIRSLG